MEWTEIMPRLTEEEFDVFRDGPMCCFNVYNTKPKSVCDLCRGLHVMVERRYECGSEDCYKAAVQRVKAAQAGNTEAPSDEAVVVVPKMGGKKSCCPAIWKVQHCTAFDFYRAEVNNKMHMRGTTQCSQVGTPQLTKALRDFVAKEDRGGFAPRNIYTKMKTEPGLVKPIRGWPSALALPEASQRTYAEIEGRKLWESIKLYFCLKQQNRGQSDPEWFQMLGRVRQGLPQPGDIDLVNSRVLSPPTSRKNATYLAYRNIDVDQANMAALRAHSTAIRHIHAHHEVHIMDSAVGEGVSQEGMRMLLEEDVDLTSSQTSHLPARLDLAIGAPVTLTYNMEQRLGLCNGSRGFVYDIIEDRLGPQPIVLVRMRDYKGQSFVDGVGGVIPILCQSATLLGGKKSSYRLSRTALPLRLGFATTIHKSQGQTCETVVLNPTSIRDSALVYVALSRARHRSDVFIAAPLDESQLQKEPPVREIEEKESARVLLIEERTTRMTTALVSEMKAEAWSHNRRALVLL